MITAPYLRYVEITIQNENLCNGCKVHHGYRPLRLDACRKRNPQNRGGNKGECSIELGAGISVAHTPVTRESGVRLPGTERFRRFSSGTEENDLYPFWDAMNFNFLGFLSHVDLNIPLALTFDYENQCAKGGACHVRVIRQQRKRPILKQRT
jgi:hypothetical protein